MSLSASGSHLAASIASALAPVGVIDDDTLEYVASLLEEDHADEDAREAVSALIASAVAGDVGQQQQQQRFDPNDICRAFFALLDLGDSEHEQVDDKDDAPERPQLRKLDHAVTLKAQDVTTYASGLSADSHLAVDLDPTSNKESQIANFYANMIDISSVEALSERDRRKARQKDLREQMEEEERQRAIQEAMAMFEAPEQTSTEETLMMEEASAMTDVHFRNFDLPNLRGGGPNLLTNASLSLARGRRYGLMGRNGCGKTTFLTFMSQRHIATAVPKNMNMLLVRQEIIGNDWSAVETVLKSDVKRESVKRYIQYVEHQLETLENPHAAADEDATPAADTEVVEDGTITKVSKSRQKLRDRKKQTQKNSAAAAKKLVPTPAIESLETQRTHWSEKLSKAYVRLAQIEELEGGDPEPRARKVLAGLGFSTEMQDKPTTELSGGWRMRVSLSCALFANPSLLLLDEPTNQ
jgi:ABC-type dipeptide/oligopeptide/nickel transport system ATPase subunit